MEITIKVGSLAVPAELNDTATAKKTAEILPIRSSFNTWGDEFYFPIDVDSQLDGSAREVVERGDLGYWPTGKAFCIFFGPTPVSRGGKIMPASAVNIIGRVTGDPELFKQAMHEREIVIEARKG